MGWAKFEKKDPVNCFWARSVGSPGPTWTTHWVRHWVRVFVMADTAYNSCCVDEVGASHIDAQCVVHYGHACMSP